MASKPPAAISPRSFLKGALVAAALGAGAIGAALSGSCNQDAFVSSFQAVRGDPYPLDELSRDVSADGAVVCPELELVTFRGDRVRLTPAVRVVAPFAERLRRFETTLIDVSLRHYGRAPKAVVNDGAYSCRSVRHRTERLSEHALGNAIDVVGFDFGPIGPAAAADAGLDAGAAHVPLVLRGALRVRVEKHWKADSGEAAVLHARFLDELTRALAEQNVFRSILGPSHPTHQTHFHLDMAPWTYFRP